MNENRFCICERCGNLIGIIHDAGVPMTCCGQKMTELIPDTADASKEKHVPVVTVKGDTVKVMVGSEIHPMEEKHNVSWVYLQTDRGGQRKCLKTGGEPVVTFALCDEKPIRVYAYCNLHGLRKTDITE